MQVTTLIKLWTESLIVILIVSVIISCNNEEEIDFTLGSGFIDKTTKITQVDTFKVEMSTIIVDSLVTSNSGVALVGCYDDGDLGMITAKDFTQIILPPSTYLHIDEEDQFDSITLVLPYTSYSYGDTNLIQELDVFLLQEEMIRISSDYYYFNSSDVEYQSNSIGNIKYLPRPNRDSIIEIRIDDAIGEDLFDKLKFEAEEVQSNDNFQQYIYGISIVPKQFQSTSIIGFSQAEISLNLYTSNMYEETEDEIDQEIYKFQSEGYQFSQIKSDRGGTLLEDINSQTDILYSSMSNNKTFVQAGTGVLTKIRFPYLNTLIFNENILLLSATLIIEADIESYDLDFPESLYLYETDEENNFNIYQEDDILSTSIFNLDEMYRIDTYYAFDITNFIQEQIEDGNFDNDRGLLITVPDPDFNSTLDRVIFTSGGNLETNPKLIINYIEI